jgi:hypothetical protein
LRDAVVQRGAVPIFTNFERSSTVPVAIVAVSVGTVKSIDAAEAT